MRYCAKPENAVNLIIRGLENFFALGKVINWAILKSDHEYGKIDSFTSRSIDFAKDIKSLPPTDF